MGILASSGLGRKNYFKSAFFGTWDPLDVAFYLLIGCLGALAFALCPISTDFMGDVYYLELAKSILARTGYGFNFKPETMLPPGFPYLLAGLIFTIGSSYAVLVRVMVVFATLGSIATYHVLRSSQDRVFAAVACLLFASSYQLFVCSTTLVFSDMPYLFFSMFLLWTLMRLDSVTDSRLWQRVSWWLLCASLLVMSILTRSTGMALLGGIAGWQAVSFFREPAQAKRRFSAILLLLLVGGGVQLTWMLWAARHQTHEWSIRGYRDHYAAQLKLRNGNDPELGNATWKDVLKRPVENADDIAAATVGLFLHKETAPAWYSPMTFIPLALILLGLGYSLWKTGGGLLEWYFISYEAMYLFWPWDFELRFFLPVAPIAFLYGWRGAVLLWRVACDRPRQVGAILLAVALIGVVSSLLWGWNVAKPQPRFCIAGWTMVAALAVVLCLRGQTTTEGLSRAILPRRWALGGAALACLMAVGIVHQVESGIGNLQREPARDPDIEAGIWIKEHASPSAVVMARKEDLVFHYGQHRVIWFPPSRNAQILMDGILRYHIQLIVVTDRTESYWRPSERECFQALARAYPHNFHLAHHESQCNVYEVVAPPLHEGVS